MERDTHRRFLEYLEAFPYWNAPSAKKLTRDEFVRLDVAYVELMARGRDSWDAEEATLVGHLKKRLLRD